MARTRLKFTEEIASKAVEYAEKGFMDIEIVHALGISESTFYRWKQRHPEFAEALVKAKYKINADLEAAALKRAIGYDADEQEVLVNVGKNGEKVNKVKKIKKHIPGDTKLLMAILRNRMPEKYKDMDKQQIEVSGGMTNTINNPFAELTTEELKKLIEK